MGVLYWCSGIFASFLTIRRARYLGKNWLFQIFCCCWKFKKRTVLRCYISDIFVIFIFKGKTTAHFLISNSDQYSKKKVLLCQKMRKKLIHSGITSVFTVGWYIILIFLQDPIRRFFTYITLLQMATNDELCYSCKHTMFSLPFTK